MLSRFFVIEFLKEFYRAISDGRKFCVIIVYFFEGNSSIFERVLNGKH